MREPEFVLRFVIRIRLRCSFFFHNNIIFFKINFQQKNYKTIKKRGVFAINWELKNN